MRGGDVIVPCYETIRLLDDCPVNEKGFQGAYPTVPGICIRAYARLSTVRAV